MTVYSIKKPKKPIVPESLVVSACLKWLWVHGCFVWRNNTGGLRDKRNLLVRFGRTGSSDIIGMTKAGKFLGIECKSSIGKLTEHQMRFRDDVQSHGGIYILARSVDDLEAKKELFA